jgi:hypothetical protein
MRGGISARYFATIRSLTVQASAIRPSDHADHFSSASRAITPFRLSLFNRFSLREAV